MIKRMTLLAGRDDLPKQHFSDHWLNTHGNIVKEMPAVSGYVQNLVTCRMLEELNVDDPFSFDGVVELWFADEAAQASAFASEAAGLLPKDEPNFIRGITIYAVNEQRYGKSAAPCKALLVVRSAAMPDESLDLSGAAIANILSALPQAWLVATSKLGKAGWRSNLWHEPAPPDIVVELGFDDAEALSIFCQSAGMEVLHQSITVSGGGIECYAVEPRRII